MLWVAEIFFCAATAGAQTDQQLIACCRCWKNAFWLITLLYPRCSMTALEMFSYSDLDVGRCAGSHPCAARDSSAHVVWKQFRAKLRNANEGWMSKHKCAGARACHFGSCHVRTVPQIAGNGKFCIQRSAPRP